MSFVHFVALISTSLIYGCLIFHCMEIPCLLVSHSSVNVRLGCFYFLANVNYYVRTTMNIHVTRICLSTCFQFFGYISISGIYASYHYSGFNCLRNCQAVFQSNCIFSHSYQQCTSVHPWQHLLFTIS